MSDEQDFEDESTADELGDREAEREAAETDRRAGNWLPEGQRTDGPAPAP
ncbi:hypothetical protein [Agromyces seonyuensis]|uniref:Uncharacterized protein n=1 Tax=Agromyces seonyuensis TaxID=2662446 RepID=A0A6I4NV30_9MICO|nr:hypothetical protein [Agromyces seonyuensis]MWB98150.1 hypothetical protein [Agromyces seonyuensis]